MSASRSWITAIVMLVVGSFAALPTRSGGAEPLLSASTCGSGTGAVCGERTVCYRGIYHWHCWTSFYYWVEDSDPGDVLPKPAED